MRFRRHRRRDPMVEPEDDGLVLYHGFLAPQAYVELNSRVHLEGFDELPRSLRDEINYAPTPELGARPTADLVGNRKDAARQLARDIARLAVRGVVWR